MRSSAQIPAPCMQHATCAVRPTKCLFIRAPTSHLRVHHIRPELPVRRVPKLATSDSGCAARSLETLMGEPFAVLDVSSKFLKPSTGVLRTRPECRQSLTYNMEYATCSMQHATYCMQHATYMGSLVWLRCSCWRALIRAHTRAVRLDELVDSDGKFRSAEIHATSAPEFLPSCIARRTHCTRQRWATPGGSEGAVRIHGWDERHR